MCPQLANRAVKVARLGDHLHVFLALEQSPQRPPQRRVIISQHHPNWTESGHPVRSLIVYSAQVSWHSTKASRAVELSLPVSDPDLSRRSTGFVTSRSQPDAWLSSAFASAQPAREATVVFPGETSFGHPARPVTSSNNPRSRFGRCRQLCPSRAALDRTELTDGRRYLSASRRPGSPDGDRARRRYVRRMSTTTQRPPFRTRRSSLDAQPAAPQHLRAASRRDPQHGASRTPRFRHQGVGATYDHMAPAEDRLPSRSGSSSITKTVHAAASPN